MAEVRTEDDTYADLSYVVLSLSNRFGRAPTEDETMAFIFGDAEKRKEIWNKGLKEAENG